MMELLLVIVIVGITGVLAFPQISRMTGKNSVARSAQVVQQDLQRAFTLAGRLRKPVTLTADNSNHAYQVTDASSNILLTRNLGTGQEYGVETMTFYPATLIIQPNGVSSDTLGVTLVSRGSARYVSMTRVGLIRRTQ
jgi:Tfp pilus assembly protein FimT